MSMLPLGGMQIPPDDAYDITSTKMQRYKVIMDSMTSPELDDPSMIGSSRIQRIARGGAGVTPDDVRDLIKYYKIMQRALKGMRGMGGGKFNMQRMMKKFGGPSK